LIEEIFGIKKIWRKGDLYMKELENSLFIEDILLVIISG
jgi:hypothetical protein